MIMQERDKEVSKRRAETEKMEKKKAYLLKQLQDQLKNLDQMDQNNFLLEKDDSYLSDPVLERLQEIQKDAQSNKIHEIKTLCTMAIGKRILNIELKKKKEQHNQKMKKKQILEEFFRENRIKKFDYHQLIVKKLQENCLIAKAYSNGKGFVESDNYYQQHFPKALKMCNFMTVVKEVNNIFYKNYTGCSQKTTLVDTLFKIIRIPIILFIILTISLPFISFDYQQIILVCLLGVILLSMIYISLKSFLDKPNSNNQMQQTLEDVKEYFQSLNNQYINQGQNIQWHCDKELMYLEVRFSDGLTCQHTQPHQLFQGFQLQST